MKTPEGNGPLFGKRKNQKTEGKGRARQKGRREPGREAKQGETDEKRKSRSLEGREGKIRSGK
jgi:hypothetical protein